MVILHLDHRLSKNGLKIGLSLVVLKLQLFWKITNFSDEPKLASLHKVMKQSAQAENWKQF